MALLFANNAKSTLQSSITSGATQIVVAEADAGLFPSPTTPDYFLATVVDAAGNMEIMRVTDRTGATLTVARAQEGTTAFAFAAGAVVDLRLTKGTMEAMTQSGDAPPPHSHVMSDITDLAAVGVPFTPTGGVSATNTQSAIAELDTEKASLSGPVFTGAVETRRADNANHLIKRMTGETGLTNDALANALRRVGDLVVEDLYEYGYGNVMSWGNGGKVGIRRTPTTYPFEVEGDLNVTGELRRAGVRVGAPRTHELFGFLPERIDANTMRFYNGFAAYAGTDPSGWVNLNKAAGYVDVALTTTGINGRDTGSLASFNNKSVAYYAAAHETDPTLNGIIASLSVSLGAVTWPSGYAATRAVKLAHEDIYFASGGLKALHINGWPLPWRDYTDLTDDGTWDVVYNINTADSYTDLDLSGWKPYSSRYVCLDCSLTGAGTLYFSVPGVADDKPAVTSTAGVTQRARVWVRTSSAGIIQWKAPSGTQARVRVVGFINSEL